MFGMPLFLNSIKKTLTCIHILMPVIPLLAFHLHIKQLIFVRPTLGKKKRCQKFANLFLYSSIKISTNVIKISILTNIAKREKRTERNTYLEEKCIFHFMVILPKVQTVISLPRKSCFNNILKSWQNWHNNLCTLLKTSHERIQLQWLNTKKN